MLETDEQKQQASRTNQDHQHAKRRGHRRNASGIPDPVAGDPAPLFAEGTVVTGRCITAKKVWKYGRPCAQLTFRLERDDPGAMLPTYTGETLVWFLSLANPTAPSSKFFQAWSHVNGGPPRRGDRMTLERFLGKVLPLVTHVSKGDDPKRPKPEMLWYSTVADIAYPPGRGPTDKRAPQVAVATGSTRTAT